MSDHSVQYNSCRNMKRMFRYGIKSRRATGDVKTTSSSSSLSRHLAPGQAQEWNTSFELLLKDKSKTNIFLSSFYSLTCFKYVFFFIENSTR